ncbi:MAG: PilZ domain-containing protein [Wenzhouxiangella sp.]|nr:PilZ domain-containing protein [Wenzhouxiangella sp.]
MTPQTSPDPEPIREPEQVQALLRRLIDARCLVHIWHPDAQEGHLSTIVGLKPVSGIYLDAPPESVIKLYHPGESLQIRSQLEGTEVRFRTRLQLHSRYENYPALLCEWPTEVHHYERRRCFRVRVVGGRAGVVLELDDAEEQHSGRVVDLSVGGFGALIGPEAHLIPGEMLDCSLDLQGQRLIVKATVRSFDDLPGTRFWRLGARFVELEPLQERRLSKLVLELERQSIQHSRGH